MELKHLGRSHCVPVNQRFFSLVWSTHIHYVQRLAEENRKKEDRLEAHLQQEEEMECSGKGQTKLQKSNESPKVEE